MIAILLTSILLMILVHWCVKKRKELENLPPGPFPFPILGNIPEMIIPKLRGQLTPVALQNFTAKYGPVSRFDFGLNRTVIIEDYELMKEVFCSESWTGRHFDEWFGERSFGKPYGLLFSSGEEWREMRRFTLRTLRDFGFGKFASQEAVAEEELGELLQRLQKSLDTSSDNIIEMKSFFTISVLNMIWSLITGIRFSHDDAKLRRFNIATTKVVKIASLGDNLANAYPILRHFYTPFVLPRVREMQKYFRDMLTEKREIGDYLEEPRDFIEVYLKEMEIHKDKMPNYFSEEQFIVLIMDLFMAGSETTSNTLEFAILYMILYPEIQEKVQQEIDVVVGANRFPTVVDKAKMPYTEAVLLELQRIANVLPVDSRSNTQDAMVGDYMIPKGTPIILNLLGLHMNPKIWKEPKVFKPERFLDSENKVINAHKILPFGLGKRVCIGEPLARFTLFIYFTVLLQKYKFSLVPGKPKPSLEPLTGVTLSPLPFSALVELR